MERPTPPDSLRDAGRDLWVSILSKYELRLDELKALEDACATTDLLRDLEQAWIDAGRPFTGLGSQGQPVEHPLIGSIDKLRKSRQAFLKLLTLPDEATTAVNQHRTAGMSRWSVTHGSGA